MQSKFRFIGLALSLLTLSAAARAETTDCTEITAVPFSITNAGVYCLKGPLIGNGTGGIEVTASNVVIDLNGYQLGGMGPNANGVNSQSRNSNITVKNGVISGGRNGVVLVGGTGLIVEGLQLQGVSEIGISVSGTASIVRHNVVGIASTYGILVQGDFARISDNEVLNTGLRHPGESVAIKVTGSQGAVIERNLVANLTAFTGGTTVPYPAGIMVSPGVSDAKVVVAGNRISNMTTGVYVVGDQSALLLDNTVSRAVTPFLGGGVLAGTTNYTF